MTTYNRCQFCGQWGIYVSVFGKPGKCYNCMRKVIHKISHLEAMPHRGYTRRTILAECGKWCRNAAKNITDDWAKTTCAECLKRKPAENTVVATEKKVDV